MLDKHSSDFLKKVLTQSLIQPNYNMLHNRPSFFPFRCKHGHYVGAELAQQLQ